MIVYIIRHGDKEKGDYFNKILNHQDYPISKEGHIKAKHLVEYFKNKQIKRLLVSEYLRTYETAQYIGDEFGLNIEKDSRLNEIDSGVIETMSDKEIKETYPDFWNDFFSRSKDVRFPEGENSEEVKARQKDLLEELIQNDQDIILVSHEGYIRLLMCHILEIPLYKRHLFFVDFCGITELNFDKETSTWKTVRLNQLITNP